MKRVYVVVGELDNGVIDTIYTVCHSMARAQELCFEAEQEDSNHVYTWYEAVEEDDE